MNCCRCGCGKEAKLGNKYILGHNGKCSSKETREKLSLASSGRVHSEETKRKISEVNSGRKRSEETKRKMSVISTGKHHSEETKKKISVAGRRNCSEETKAKISFANRGENCSEETRRKMSASQKGKHLSEETKAKLSIANIGERCSLWQGGIQYEPYGLGNNGKLKEQIRKRDNHSCQECDKVWVEREEKFAPHHIDFNKNNHGFWNRITLCRSCHSKTNLNRKYWEERYTLFLLAKYGRLII